jgi:hypothetical protein
MTSLKSATTFLLTLLFGIALGAFFSHTQKVHASSGIRVQKVIEGYNMVVGTDYLGFACTQQDCYVASR